MSAETDDIELAQWLNGIGSSKQRSETPTNDPGATKTIYGTATSDSDNGTVYVDLEGTTVSGSGEQSVPLTTTCPVKNGQKVIITLVNNDPVVTGVAGWGDEANQKIAAAEKTANEAINKVEKTNYYFWTDSSGAHVTTQPNDATTGPNILIDGNGFHIRQGEVETAFFKSDEIRLGSNSQTSVIRLCGGLGEIGTVSSSNSSVLALFGELVGLRGSSGSTVGNNLASLTATDDDVVLSANGSIVLNSKISYISTENTDSRIYLFGTNGYLKPLISSDAQGYNGPVLSGKTYAGIETGTANSDDLNTGVYCISTPDENSNGIVFNALQFLPGTNGSFLPIETLYNHAVMAMPNNITTTKANVFQAGEFHSIAKTGDYVFVNSSGAIEIFHTGTYLISLYGVWYECLGGDYMHFAIGPSNSDVRFAVQRVVHGLWDSGSRTGMLRFTKGTVLYPMVKCEQGVPNKLAGGDNPGDAGQSSCFIQYVGE